jgi:hypothetical protein
VLQVAVTVWLPGVTVNPEETQTWAVMVSGRARKKAAESSNKNVAAWGNGLMNASPILPKGLRMGAVLSWVGYERAAENWIGAIVFR